MGEDDGALVMVGKDECVSDGVFEGITDGTPDGMAENMTDGTPEGMAEGTVDSMSEGIPEGFVFGEVVCDNVGDAVGFCVYRNAVGYVGGDAILLEGSDGTIRVYC
eukprot:14626077-Ditylum_brightwellii.AAC.1